MELLSLLQEEAAEVVIAVSKLERFGDIQHLHDEIGDVMGVLKLLVEEKFIDEETMIEGAERKIKKLDRYIVNKKTPELLTE